MRININIDDSIATSRLKYSFPSRWEMLDHVYFFIYSIVFIGTAAMLLINYNLFAKQFNLLVITIVIVPVILGLLSLYSLLQFDRLIRFKGISLEANAELMAKIIEKRFGIKPARTNKILKYYRRPGFWKNGKRLIVILDEDDVLINIATFNFKNIRSPMHGLFDRIKIASIKKEFEKLKENKGA